MDDFKSLLREPLFSYFYQICQIPHGSGNETVLGEWILRWAQETGLTAQKDAYRNVLIRRPASPGYAGTGVVMLQAHLDMVCEKREGSAHDFRRDPIRWVLEGDILSTGGETTLGADDGIGVALAMAALTETERPMPELEVLFTTNEEEDLSGAENFDGTGMRARRLINLDHVSEHEILCGSCGGMQVNFTLPLDRTPPPPGWSALRVHVSGLRGGHSGEDIHRGRGNANILLARCLSGLAGELPLKLAGLEGGSSRLAIPTHAWAEICVPPEVEARAAQCVAEYEKLFRQELSATGDGLTLTVSPAAPAEGCVEPQKILDAMLLIPDGIYQMNESLVGLVDTSDNLGEAYLREDRLELILEIRSARESLRTYLYERMRRLARLLGAEVRWSNAYPSWDYRPQSPLAEVCRRVHREAYGTEPQCLTVHAGLEVGCISQKKAELDAVSIGPDIWDLHSVDERMSVSSARRFYGYLLQILAALAAETP